MKQGFTAMKRNKPLMAVFLPMLLMTIIYRCQLACSLQAQPWKLSALTHGFSGQAQHWSETLSFASSWLGPMPKRPWDLRRRPQGGFP